MSKSENKSRRKFLSLLTSPGQHQLAEKDEKVTLLTADGKLVEVSKQLVQQAKSGKKAPNQEILRWSQSTKPKS